MIELLTNFIIFFNYTVGFYYVILNTCYTLLLTLSLIMILKYLNRLKYSPLYEIIKYSSIPPISIIISAFNEKNTIINTLNSAIKVNYPFLEIIVVNDGSTDNTLDLLIKNYKLKKSIFFIYRQKIKTKQIKGLYYSELYPNLIVIDKEQTGKADSLNCGINVSKSPYLCSVDADSTLEKDALIRLTRKIVESRSPVIALGGVIRILNGIKIEDGEIKDIELPRKCLPVFQIVEYIRGFLFGRLGWETLKGSFILSGAFTLLKKDAVIEVGGFFSNTVTEDLEMIARLHHHYRLKKEPYYIGFIPDPVCWTEVPEKISILGKQRRRWHLGLLQTLWIYKKMLFNPRFGRIGILVMPFYLLEALGAIIETLGYPIVILSYLFGLLNIQFLILFITLAIVYGIFLSVGGIFLEEMSFKRYPKWSHLFRLLIYGVLENFGYRQLISFFKFIATFQFLFGYKKWEYVHKTGKT